MDYAPPLLVLGIETSCDETAAAVLRREAGGVTIFSDVVLSQVKDHAPYKGVVPEIAARAHVEGLDGVIAAAMSEAGVGFADLDAVAATAGPGLIGGVMVGLTAAKAIALAHNKPLIPVNHLEGHALSPRLAAPVAFPYLLLLASGGHCQFIAVEGVKSYRRLGTTIDDAAGEAFDKTAKTMDLGFPGGPALEATAKGGDPKLYVLPKPMAGREGCDMSFAGLKTAVARLAEGMANADKPNLCASFQATMCAILKERAGAAMDMYEELLPDARRFVVAGGVAANQALREGLKALAAERGFDFFAPPLRHCTDNAAMIALAGAEILMGGFSESDSLSFAARPRWPLDGEAARLRPSHKPGRKGAKA
jgi:N6-L-threonylcarbamoyladenine synthase